MPRLSSAAAAALTVCVWGAACALSGSAYEPQPSESLAPPPTPPIESGPLSVRVVYPPTARAAAARPGELLTDVSQEPYQIQSRDSAFIFGSVGRGDAQLTVNGQPIPVYATGGWIAWLPLPDDTVARFDIVASADNRVARLVLFAPIAHGFTVPETGAWIDTTSLSPAGDRWIRPGEGVRLSLRATPGAEVRGVLPDGTGIPFLRDMTPEELPWGERAFGTTSPGVNSGPARADRYVAWWPGRLGPDPGLVLSPSPPAELTDSRWMRLEAVVGSDTARVRWPLRLGVVETEVPTVVVVNDDPAQTGATDRILAGRPSPLGTYHWFFPNGTIAVVSGRWNNQVRLQLSRTSVAWVDVADLQPLPPGTAPPGGTARSLRLVPAEHSVVLRVPLPARVPFRVDETERHLLLTLYGVAADMDWIQYGGTDPVVELVAFSQPKEDEAVVTISLAEKVWGYRTRWDGNDLLLEVRRPPRIDPRRPLLGRVVVLDAGHPPLGATGPTGVREPDAVLGVARKAAQLLGRFGARAVLIRDTEQPIGLAERIEKAERSDGEVLISIHANALPDGVNPFVNNGTSVYYFHPRSAALARELDRALVRQFGFRDLGMGRGDLALVRPTWMPAALTEGLFMMIPQQEAVLAAEDGQWRYARGIVEGVAAFFRERALHGR